MYADTKCTKTAGDAAQHAVAKAAYSETLSKTGCEKTAQATYDKVMASAQPVTAGEAHTS